MKNTLIAVKPAKRPDTAARICALAVGLAFSTALPLPLFAAQDDEIELVPLLPPIGDIGGVWNYTTSFPIESGPCPSGFAMSGEILVTTHPAGVTPPNFDDTLGQFVRVSILSGSECRPETICQMAGYINDNKTDSGMMGKVVTVGAFATVDDEHGQVNSAWTLYFNSATEGVGTGGAEYTHPDGSCSWAYDILLERSLDDSK